MSEEQPSTLYVWGLDREVSQEKLKEEFENTAKIKIKRVTIICNKETGKSKGFGYVECESSEDATKAFAEMEDKVINDVPLQIKYSYTETPGWLKHLDEKADGGGERGGGRGRGRGYERGGGRGRGYERGGGRGRGDYHGRRESFDERNDRNDRFDRYDPVVDQGYRGRGGPRGGRGDMRGGRGGNFRGGRGDHRGGPADYRDGQGGYRGRGEHRGGRGSYRGRGDFQHRDDRFASREPDRRYGREDNDRYGRFADEQRDDHFRPMPYSRYEKSRRYEDESYGRGADQEDRYAERRQVDDRPYGNQEHDKRDQFDTERGYDELAEAAPLRRRPEDRPNDRHPLPRDLSYGEPSRRLNERSAALPQRSSHPLMPGADLYRDEGYQSERGQRGSFPDRHDPIYRDQVPPRNRSPLPAELSRYPSSASASARHRSRSPTERTRGANITGRYPVKDRVRENPDHDADYDAAVRVAEAVKSLASAQPRKPISLESYSGRLHPSLRGAIKRNAETYSNTR